MKFKHVVHQVEESASFKISELEKLKYSGYHTTYSVLAYIFISIDMIYGLRFLFPYCKTNTALKAIAASTKEHLGLTTEAP
jgi:hypothetical protein